MCSFSKLISFLQYSINSYSYAHISRYIFKNKYDNAEQDDLWESLSIEAHAAQVLPCEYSVKEIMDTWTKQKGYPLLSIKRNSTTAVVVSQVFI